LLSTFFDPDDGGNMFIWNTVLPPNYTML
jgi:hypothetical protein